MLWKSLCNAINGQNMTRLGFAAQLLAIKKLSRRRHEQGLQIGSAEAYAGRIGRRHRNDGIDPAVRPIAYHPAAGEECGPQSARDVDARAVGPLAGGAVIREQPSVANRAVIEIEVELPGAVTPRIREIERAIVGRESDSIRHDDIAEHVR